MLEEKGLSILSSQEPHLEQNFSVEKRQHLFSLGNPFDRPELGIIFGWSVKRRMNVLNSEQKFKRTVVHGYYLITNCLGWF